MRVRLRWIGVVVAAVLAGPVASASAADTFVDAAIGDDSNSCLTAGSACATIGAGIGKAGAGDTVRVGPGAYPEQLTLGDGKSLVATGTAASTVIEPATAPAVDVAGAAGTIQGFTIRGVGSDPAGAPPPVGVVRLAANATVRDNIFDDDDDTSAEPVDLVITAAANAPVVERNSFTDDGVGSADAVRSSSPAAVIADNRIKGFATGITTEGGNPTLRENLITDHHLRGNGNPATGIAVRQGTANSSPTLVGNVVRSPASASSGGISIIDFVHGGGSPSLGATLRRNRVQGNQTGVTVHGTLLPVSLESDLVTGSSLAGVQMSDTVGGSGTVSATNMTAASNATDISTNQADLTLDSTLVEDAIGVSGVVTCTITFSRGPTTTAGGNGCQSFQTTAAPVFKDAAGGDFHLRPFPDNGALEADGNSAAPAAGTRDFDGDLRELPSNGTSAPRREIGADEIPPGGYAPAETTITSGPADAGAANGAPQFGFSSNDPTAAFECSLDGRAFAPCTSPQRYGGLDAGAHSFAVRSVIAPEGNYDPTPATRSVTVDSTPPETQFDSGPAQGATTGTTSAFVFGSEPGASFECSLDGAAFTACSANETFGPLGEGAHRLVVRALDGVGNADRTAAGRTWNVDATAPETTIDSGPADAATTDSGAVTYGFSANDPATFECAVDDGAFASCASPQALELAPGAHTFAVRATDEFGNTDGSPATRTLTVRRGGGGGGDDTDPPETTIRRIKVKGDDAKARFTSDEPGSTFECKLDRKKFKACRSPRKLKNLDDGRHKLKVRAVDPAGNRDPSAAKKKFGVG